jgi:hypothetical protein
VSGGTSSGGGGASSPARANGVPSGSTPAHSSNPIFPSSSCCGSIFSAVNPHEYGRSPAARRSISACR